MGGRREVGDTETVIARGRHGANCIGKRLIGSRCDPATLGRPQDAASAEEGRPPVRRYACIAAAPKPSRQLTRHDRLALISFS